MSLASRSFEGQTATLGVDELRHLAIPNDSVFASIAIRDGHELSVVVVPPGKRPCVNEVVISTEAVTAGSSSHEPINWAELADEINLWAPYWAKQEQLPIPWHAPFIELGKGLIREAIRTSARCKTIYFAMDECLRGLPWQHLFGVRLKQFTDDLRLQLGISDAYPPLLICHVPSAYHFCTAMRQRKPLKQMDRVRATWEIDDSDPKLVALAASIRQAREGQSINRAVKITTILAHGLRSSEMVEIVFDGKKSDRSELLNKCSAGDLALFHVCNAGFFSQALRGDLGGLPGMLISFGVKVVVAPVAPVAISVVRKFEQYISTWLGDPNKTFPEMYADAVLKYPAISLYSLFGDPDGLT